MKPGVRHGVVLAAAVLAARLPWLLLSPGAPYDLGSYALAAASSARGLYSAPALAGRYPYLPLWWLCLKALSLGQTLLGGAPDLWFRLPALAGDLAISLLAYAFALGRPGGPHGENARRAALIAGLAWALNPLSALISAGHGQFDSLVLGLVLGAAWLLERSARPHAEVWAALCLAAAIALKTWPLAFLPAFFSALPGARARARFTAWALLPPLLLLLPWLRMDGFRDVAAHLAYCGATGLGLSAVVKSAFFAARAAPEAWGAADICFRALALLALAAVFVRSLWRASRTRLREGLPWMALSLVLFAPGLSPQYLVWAPALALPLSPRWTARLSLAALPLAAGFYALFMPVVLAGRLAWKAPHDSPALIAAWGAANLLWWCWTLRQWKGLTRECRL